MDFSFELYFPPEFFESSGKNGNYESVSERIAKSILTKFLNTKESEVHRGNPQMNEPDYLFCDKGYEVTFGVSEAFIKQLRGVQETDSEETPIEQSLIDAIHEAIERKSKKRYSTRKTATNLFVLSIQPFPLWYRNIPLEHANSFENLAQSILSQIWSDSQSTRNKFFKNLYNEYIKNDLFEDIFILLMGTEKSYYLISIKKYIDDPNDYQTLFIPNNLVVFPYCHIISSDIGLPGEPIKCSYFAKVGTWNNK